MFATSNRVIARFEVARVLSPLDKVALANIRGSGVWSDEPQVTKSLQRAKS